MSPARTIEKLYAFVIKIKFGKSREHFTNNRQNNINMQDIWLPNAEKFKIFVNKS